MTSPIGTPPTTPRNRSAAETPPRSPETPFVWLLHVIAHSRTGSQEDYKALQSLAAKVPVIRAEERTELEKVVDMLSCVVREKRGYLHLNALATQAHQEFTKKKPEPSPQHRPLRSPFSFLEEDV